MADHTYDDFVPLEDNQRFDIGSSHGVCDLSFSQFDEVGNVVAYMHATMDPEVAIKVAATIAKSAMAAKNFHAEVVAQLRASQNGQHEADGEA